MTTYLLHGHHDTLVCEYYSKMRAQKRIDQIRSGLKPLHETPTRLRLMRILTKKEVTPYVAASKAFEDAEASALKAYNEAYTEAMALKAYKRVMAVASKTYKEAVAAWHRFVCVKDCPWDGETIFPEARQ